MRQLATGRWIAEHRNVLITGATGVGKPFLACALGQHACRQGDRAIYTGACRASFRSSRWRDALDDHHEPVATILAFSPWALP